MRAHTARRFTTEQLAQGVQRIRHRRKHKPHRSAIRLNIAPMIDMTFLLLVFFLVTTRFARSEGMLSSKMPQDRGQVGVPLPISPIVVRIKQVGEGVDDFAITLDNVDAFPATFTQLAQVLSEIQSRPGFDKETPVVIIPDEDVWWDHVVNAWNAALRAECRNIAFGAE